MKVHEFTLMLTADPNEEESAQLYSIFDDGTIVTIASVPQIHFHRAAPSLEAPSVLRWHMSEKQASMWSVWKPNREIKRDHVAILDL
jgi:hypothetical protein